LKTAYLGPFITAKLRPFISSLTESDCYKSPGMGGYGLIELVEERLGKKEETAVITLDTKLENESIIRKGDYCALYCLPKIFKEPVDIVLWFSSKAKCFVVEIAAR